MFRAMVDFSYRSLSVDYESILLKAQDKAKRLAAKVEAELRKNTGETAEDASIRLSAKIFKKQTVAPATQVAEVGNKRLNQRLNQRLNLNIILDAYQKTGLQPYWDKYWFYDDLRLQPLIQSYKTNEQRSAVTPIAVICLLYRQEIVAGTRIVEAYVANNSSFVNGPSNKWYLGSIAQLTGLNCSYLLGFDIGYNDNYFNNKYASTELLNGIEDGKLIRQYFIETLKIVTPLDEFVNEQNPHKLSELFRIGYYYDDSEELITQRQSNDN